MPRKIFQGGWQFFVCDGEKKVNVNYKVKDFIDQNDIFKLSKPYELNALFNLSERKSDNKNDSFLCIENNKIKNWKNLKIKNNTDLTIDLKENISEEKQEINIIYFFNSLLSPLFYKLFKTQLKELLKSKILHRKKTSLYIVCVANKKRSLRLNKVLDELNIKNLTNLKIDYIEKSNFEYEGIQKAFEIAGNSHNSFVIYFHGKGISHLKTSLLFLRHPYEVLSFNRVIKRWRENLQWFSRVKNIEKLGLLNSDGWMLFNFWWAKSSFVNKLEIPLKTSNRYYYEVWISKLPKKQYSSEDKKSIREIEYINTIDSCINIIDNKKLKKYNIGTTCHIGAPDMIYLGICEFLYLPWYRIVKIFNIIFRR